MARKFARSDFEADDLFDKANRRAWKKITGFRRGAAFTSWFYVIIRSIYCSEAEKAGKKALDIAKPIELLTQYEGNDGAFENGSELWLGSNGKESLKAKLLDAVESSIVTERQRKLVKKHYLVGEPLKEIAEELGIRLDHARVEISRAKQRLRERLSR